MYYSFKCTYCGRLFYTYNFNKQRASEDLYSTIKQHLIETGEDDKEYEMDDGATEDSNQIYAEMTVSDHRPAGGFEATHHTGLKSTTHKPSSTHHVPAQHKSTASSKHESDTNTHASSHSGQHASQSYKLTIILLLIAVGIIILIAFMLLSQGMLDEIFYLPPIPQLNN
jgi:hypothetical protein